MEKMTLTDAGAALGISPDAVRMRVKRGTMRGEKDAQGRWQVWIDLAEQEGEQEGEKRGEEKPEVEMLPPREYGKTRDKVAAAVGLGSGRTYKDPNGVR